MTTVILHYPQNQEHGLAFSTMDTPPRTGLIPAEARLDFAAALLKLEEFKKLDYRPVRWLGHAQGPDFELPNPGPYLVR